MKKQSELKKIGIWMDHAQAKLINPDDIDLSIRELASTLNPRERIAGETADGIKLGGFRSSNNEFAKHEKEQNATHAYYKKLAVELLPYDMILIFGPTTARQEFYNYLKEEHNFSNKVITTVDGNYNTDNQLKAFVKKSFADGEHVQ